MIGSVIWSDIQEDFSIDAQGAIKIVTNAEAVHTSIDNILGTFQGERVMLPGFASKIRMMLFEPMTTELQQFIADEIKSVVESWDNRVTVLSVDYFQKPDSGTITLKIAYVLRGYSKIFYNSQEMKQGGQNVQ